MTVRNVLTFRAGSGCTPATSSGRELVPQTRSSVWFRARVSVGFCASPAYDGAPEGSAMQFFGRNCHYELSFCASARVCGDPSP